MNSRTIRLPLLAATLLVLVGACAEAATLDAIRGEVMVSRGAGFRPVSGPVELNPGDLVIVNPGGSARIHYGAGCAVPVVAGAVVSVNKQSPCAQAKAKAAVVAARPALPKEGLMRANGPGAQKGDAATAIKNKGTGTDDGDKTVVIDGGDAALAGGAAAGGSGAAAGAAAGGLAAGIGGSTFAIGATFAGFGAVGYQNFVQNPASN